MKRLILGEIFGILKKQAIEIIIKECCFPFCFTYLCIKIYFAVYGDYKRDTGRDNRRVQRLDRLDGQIFLHNRDGQRSAAVGREA